MNSSLLGVVLLVLLVLGALGMDVLLVIFLISQGRRTHLVGPVVHGIGVVLAIPLHYLVLRTWGLSFGVSASAILDIYSRTSLALSVLVATSALAIALWYRALQKA